MLFISDSIIYIRIGSQLQEQSSVSEVSRPPHVLLSRAGLSDSERFCHTRVSFTIPSSGNGSSSILCPWGGLYAGLFDFLHSISLTATFPSVGKSHRWKAFMGLCQSVMHYLDRFNSGCNRGMWISEIMDFIFLTQAESTYLGALQVHYALSVDMIPQDIF